MTGGVLRRNSEADRVEGEIKKKLKEVIIINLYMNPNVNEKNPISL